MESCPKSKEEWDIAARKKNCNTLAAEVEGENCKINKKQLEYHCLINSFRDKYLEVCVVAKIIIGNVGICFFFNSLWKFCFQKYYIRSGCKS